MSRKLTRTSVGVLISVVALLITMIGPAAEAKATSSWLSASHDGKVQVRGRATTYQKGKGKVSGTQKATFTLQARYKLVKKTKANYRGVYGAMNAMHTQLVPRDVFGGTVWERLRVGTANKQTTRAQKNSSKTVSVAFKNAYGGAGELYIQIRVCADKKWAPDPCSKWWSTYKL